MKTSSVAGAKKRRESKHFLLLLPNDTYKTVGYGTRTNGNVVIASFLPAGNVQQKAAEKFVLFTPSLIMQSSVQMQESMVRATIAMIADTPLAAVHLVIAFAVIDVRTQDPIIVSSHTRVMNAAIHALAMNVALRSRFGISSRGARAQIDSFAARAVGIQNAPSAKRR